VGKLSRAISEGDGISILVEVSDANGASTAERQGAAGLVVRSGGNPVRAASQLPLLHLGNMYEARGVAADALAIRPELTYWHEAQSQELEGVVRVTDAAELRKALSNFDPEVFLLSVPPESDADPLEALLALLHDVPAGKLAIAELPHATAEDVAELERSGMDAVIVVEQDLEALVPTGAPEV